jgi:hypothetical protein
MGFTRIAADRSDSLNSYCIDHYEITTRAGLRAGFSFVKSSVSNAVPVERAAALLRQIPC